MIIDDVVRVKTYTFHCHNSSLAVSYTALQAVEHDAIPTAICNLISEPNSSKPAQAQTTVGEVSKKKLHELIRVKRSSLSARMLQVERR